MYWIIRSLMFSMFWRLFNTFLVLFFLVHVVRSRSVVAPMRDTLVTVAGWLGSAGEQTEKSFSKAIGEARKRID